MDKLMKAYPRSTIAMDANTLKVVATGKNANRLHLKDNPSLIIFKRPNPDMVL